MKSKRIVFGIIALVVGVAVLFLLLSLRGNGESTNPIDSVTIQKDGNTLTVSRNGTVRYTRGGEEFEDFWEEEKINTFFKYIDGKYAGADQIVSGGQNYLVINKGGSSSTHIIDEDELIDVIENETSGGSGGSGTEGAGPGGNGGSGGNGGGGSGSGGNGGSAGNDECLYWRISYCVRYRTPTPTPVGTPPPAEIREPNCEANTQTGRTVIGNELCLPTPSPTPTPTS